MEKEKSAAEALREELMMKKEHFSVAMSEEEVAKADRFCEGYMQFLNDAKTERECVDYMVEKAEKLGFTAFDKTKTYKPGDKVYLNNEWEWGYRESDALDGYDPYSNSKSCSELVTSSYKKSFLNAKDIAVSTCRAGNVIGGGDFAPDRIIPDCVRAMEKGTEIIVRNPYSTRPYQHVLEPVVTYLVLAMKQYQDHALAGCYNIGPDDCDCVETGELVDIFCSTWGDGTSWKNVAEANAPHEANFLKLDCSKIKRAINWTPRWHITDAIEKVVEWSKAYIGGENVNSVMEKQIKEYLDK